MTSSRAAPSTAPLLAKLRVTEPGEVAEHLEPLCDSIRKEPRPSPVFPDLGEAGKMSHGVLCRACLG